ncbi:hypothetical protein BDF20DRAFT_885978 [Mycotypha africana]|uniref:uncharacterized protein n=1 Tax=Mycotypha africana TaxID=64632 RepID=UPI0023015A82|nr:uncharacterized protein BDF20DRAFT_885978 [Mycotypha africana]KAI8971717.1 hypothetical protein BDF20DRAFT_885978 [Mycotypha africana]
MQSSPALPKHRAVLSDSRTLSPDAEQRIAATEDTKTKLKDSKEATEESKSGTMEQQSEYEPTRNEDLAYKNKHLVFENTVEVARRSPVHLPESFLFNEPLTDESSSFEFLSYHKDSPTRSPLGSPIVAEKKTQRPSDSATASPLPSQLRDVTNIEEDAEEELDRAEIERVQKEMDHKSLTIDEKEAQLRRVRQELHQKEDELSHLNERLSEVEALETKIADLEDKTKEYKEQFQELVEILGQSTIAKKLDSKEATINELLNHLSEIQYKIHELKERRRRQEE